MFLVFNNRFLPRLQFDNEHIDGQLIMSIKRMIAERLRIENKTNFIKVIIDVFNNSMKDL